MRCCDRCRPFVQLAQKELVDSQKERERLDKEVEHLKKQNAELMSIDIFVEKGEWFIQKKKGLGYSDKPRCSRCMAEGAVNPLTNLVRCMFEIDTFVKHLNSLY